MGNMLRKVIWPLHQEQPFKDPFLKVSLPPSLLASWRTHDATSRDVILFYHLDIDGLSCCQFRLLRHDMGQHDTPQFGAFGAHNSNGRGNACATSILDHRMLLQSATDALVMRFTPCGYTHRCCLQHTNPQVTISKQKCVAYQHAPFSVMPCGMVSEEGS